jgi:hypothetical protein
MSRQRAFEICANVKAVLRASPTFTIANVARTLGLSEATVRLACRLGAGGFRSVRAEVRFRLARNLLATKVPRSIKETAILLGCSHRTLSRNVATNSGMTPVGLRTALATGCRPGSAKPERMGLAGRTRRRRDDVART